MPKISVIIPNYNHARFLEQRFTSILAQTFQDYEIIYLDDASTDDSNEIALRFLSQREGSKAFYNATNSGNPFKQWNRGAREAEGEYLWIAESDDFADERLLETLVRVLDDNPQVGVAYCQSWVVDDANRVVSSMQEGYRLDLCDARWKKAFINNGRDECARWMIIKNTIPNASAVLIRKAVYDTVGGADETMTLSGDWSTWVKMLLVSDVAFIPEHCNYFRDHGSTVRHRTVNTVVFVQEAYQIARKIMEHTGVDDHTREHVSALLFTRWWTHRSPLGRGCWLDSRRIFKDARVVDVRFYRRLAIKLLTACWARASRNVLRLFLTA